MKIIKEGNPVKKPIEIIAEASCSNCGCVFQYNNDNISRYYEGGTATVCCPNCRKGIPAPFRLPNWYEFENNDNPAEEIQKALDKLGVAPKKREIKQIKKIAPKLITTIQNEKVQSPGDWEPGEVIMSIITALALLAIFYSIYKSI